MPTLHCTQPSPVSGIVVAGARNTCPKRLTAPGMSGSLITTALSREYTGNTTPAKGNTGWPTLDGFSSSRPSHFAGHAKPRVALSALEKRRPKPNMFLHQPLNGVRSRTQKFPSTTPPYTRPVSGIVVAGAENTCEKRLTAPGMSGSLMSTALSREYTGNTTPIAGNTGWPTFRGFFSSRPFIFAGHAKTRVAIPTALKRRSEKKDKTSVFTPTPVGLHTHTQRRNRESPRHD